MSDHLGHHIEPSLLTKVPDPSGTRSAGFSPARSLFGFSLAASRNHLHIGAGSGSGLKLLLLNRLPCYCRVVKFVANWQADS